MRDIIDKFCDCFPNISFEITVEKIKHQLSLDSISTGEREILRMLNEAQRQLAKIKKLHKSGKASAEEVFDYEWRVHELEEELNRFNNANEPDDFEDLV
jgi:hypothetical protein